MTDGVRTYRKRPVVVAAMRFTGSPNNRDALEAWGVKLKMMPHEGTIVTALWVQANKTWLPASTSFRTSSASIPARSRRSMRPTSR
jgi:hypothetical protein